MYESRAEQNKWGPTLTGLVALHFVMMVLCCLNCGPTELILWKIASHERGHNSAGLPTVSTLDQPFFALGNVSRHSGLIAAWEQCVYCKVFDSSDSGVFSSVLDW